MLDSACCGRGNAERGVISDADEPRARGTSEVVRPGSARCGGPVPSGAPTDVDRTRAAPRTNEGLRLAPAGAAKGDHTRVARRRAMDAHTRAARRTARSGHTRGARDRRPEATRIRIGDTAVRDIRRARAARCSGIPSHRRRERTSDHRPGTRRSRCTNIEGNSRRRPAENCRRRRTRSGRCHIRIHTRPRSSRAPCSRRAREPKPQPSRARGCESVASCHFDVSLHQWVPTSGREAMCCLIRPRTTGGWCAAPGAGPSPALRCRAPRRVLARAWSHRRGDNR